MNLTEHQARAARYCVAEVVRRRLLSGAPVPPWMRTLHQHLSTADGTEYQAVQQQSEAMIDTAEAAKILGCTARYVRRIAADLDGQNIAGRWIFNRRNVTDYAEGKNE